MLDHYAYSNRLRMLDPAHKAGLAALLVGLCLLLDRPAVGLTAVGWAGLLAVGWAGLPARVFGRALLAEALFLAMAVLGLALELALARPAGAVWAWQLGPLWLASSPVGLALALRVLCRALGAAAALSWLAMTTPAVDLIELARRWGAPELLLDLATLIYRFLWALQESLVRMRTAQECRLGYAGWRRGMRSAGLLAALLLLDAYRRAQRLELALASRCGQGGLRVLPLAYRADRRTPLLALVIAATLLLAWCLG